MIVKSKFSKSFTDQFLIWDFFQPFREFFNTIQTSPWSSNVRWEGFVVSQIFVSFEGPTFNPRPISYTQGTLRTFTLSWFSQESWVSNGGFNVFGSGWLGWNWSGSRDFSVAHLHTISDTHASRKKCIASEVNIHVYCIYRSIMEFFVKAYLTHCVHELTKADTAPVHRARSPLLKIL